MDPSRTPTPAPPTGAAPGMDRQHFRRLDGLRGLAVLMVVCTHCLGIAFNRWELPWRSNGLLLTTRLPAGGHVPMAYVLLWPVTYGWVAVGVFLVLSGFGIHYAHVRSGRPFAPVAFAGRRFLRIYPPYLLALVGATAIIWLRHEEPVGWLVRQFAYHALLIHNVSPDTFVAVNGSMWTLAVECQFYAMYPLLLWARSRSVTWGPLALAGGVSVACWSVAWARIDWIHLRWAHPDLAHLTAISTFTWWNTFPQWICWAMGMSLADQFAAGRRVFFPRPVAWGVGLLVATVAAGLFKPTWGLGLTVSAVLSAVVVEGSLWAPAYWNWLGNRWLVLLGTISYTFYLWHQPLLEPLATALHVNRLPAAAQFVTLFAVALVIVGAISWVLHVAVERPSQQASKNFGRRPRPAAPATAPVASAA